VVGSAADGKMVSGLGALDRYGIAVQKVRTIEPPILGRELGDRLLLLTLCDWSSTVAKRTLPPD